MPTSALILQLLRLLSQGWSTLPELAAALRVSDPTIRRGLRQVEDAGLHVERSEETPVRFRARPKDITRWLAGEELARPRRPPRRHPPLPAHQVERLARELRESPEMTIADVARRHGLPYEQLRTALQRLRER